MTHNESQTSNAFDAAIVDTTKLPYDYDASLNGTSRQTSPEVTNATLTSFDDDYEEMLLNQVKFYFWLWKVVTPTLFAIFAVCGTIGNTLVVYVVISRPQMRTVTNVLLVSLAFADIAFLVICVPSTAHRYVADTWPFGNTVCRLTSYLLYVTTYVTVYTLVAITSFRFASVVYPDQTERFRTRRNAIWLALIVWAASALGNAPTLPAFVVKTNEDFSYSYCGMEASAVLPMIVGFFTVGYVLPLTAIALLNVLIVAHLAMRRQGVASRAVTSTASVAAASPGSMAPSAVDDITRRSRLRQIRTAKILFPLVLAFGLTWLPLHVQSLVALRGRLPSGNWSVCSDQGHLM